MERAEDRHRDSQEQETERHDLVQTLWLPHLLLEYEPSDCQRRHRRQIGSKHRRRIYEGAWHERLASELLEIIYSPPHEIHHGVTGRTRLDQSLAESGR